MKEIWKDIPNYVGRYKASNFGRIKSVDMVLSYKRHNAETTRIRKGKVLSPAKMRNGYLRVEMSVNGEHKLNLVHQLVAQAFIPNPNNYEQINHIDGNKENNCVDNLEWATPHENMKHAYKNNLISKDKMNYCIQSSINFRKKPILQIKDNVVVSEFDSIESAKKMLKVKSSGCLVNALKGRIKTYKGFVWTYKEKGN